jgi:hypothetical protein
MLMHEAAGNSTSAARHLAHRAKKAVDVNAKAIESRIRYFQREEEKIWRDLEEVRRQAATIEEGRSRTLEKKIADRTIQQERELMVRQNRARAAATKSTGQEQRKRNQFQAMKEKQIAGQEQRRTSQEILRQKRVAEDKARLANYERAVSAQRATLEAKLKINQEKVERIERMREAQEQARQDAELEVQDAESRLPELEAEELVCLQRLQNSRIVTQSVLEELETSLGSRNSVTSLLRSKQKDHIDMGNGSFLAHSSLAEEADEGGAMSQLGQDSTEWNMEVRDLPPPPALAAAEAGSFASGGPQHPASRSLR